MGRDRGLQRRQQQQADSEVDLTVASFGLAADFAVTGEPLTDRQRLLRRWLLEENHPCAGSALWRPDSESPPLDLELLRRYADAIERARSTDPSREPLNECEGRQVAECCQHYRLWAVARSDLLADYLFRPCPQNDVPDG